jgi:toxin secretion/phage lysis holin
MHSTLDTPNVILGWEAKTIVASIASFIIFIIGGWDVLAQALVLLIALDVAGGLAQAFYEKRLNSSIMRKGLIRKTGYFAAIALAVLVDRALFQAQPAFRTLVLSYLCVSEALSVLEHLAAIGVPLPAQLKRALEKLRHEMDDDNPRQPAE